MRESVKGQSDVLYAQCLCKNLHAEIGHRYRPVVGTWLHCGIFNSRWHQPLQQARTGDLKNISRDIAKVEIVIGAGAGFVAGAGAEGRFVFSPNLFISRCELIVRDKLVNVQA